jgi:hypothetical protein
MTKIHEEPLSYDLLSDEEKEELLLEQELLMEQSGGWEPATQEELDALERPDHSSKLEDFYVQPLWSEILPNLWQGGTSPSDDLSGRGYPIEKARIDAKDFDTVITMYASAQPVQWQVKEYRFGIYDSNMTDFDSSELFDIVRLAHKDWAEGKRVLIRCQAGWNRSGLVTALVLLREGWKMDTIIDLIREKRSRSALCNAHFVRFLLDQKAQDWQGESYGSKPVVDIKN